VKAGGCGVQRGGVGMDRAKEEARWWGGGVDVGGRGKGGEDVKRRYESVECRRDYREGARNEEGVRVGRAG